MSSTQQAVLVSAPANSDKQRQAYLAGLASKRQINKQDPRATALAAIAKKADESVLFNHSHKDLPIYWMLKEARELNVDSKIIAGWELKFMQDSAWDAVIEAKDSSSPYFWGELLKISARFHRLDNKESINLGRKYTIAETMDFIEKRSSLNAILTIGDFDARKTFWAYVHMKNRNKIPREVVGNMDVPTLMTKYLDGVNAQYKKAA